MFFVEVFKTSELLPFPILEGRLKMPIGGKNDSLYYHNFGYIVVYLCAWVRWVWDSFDSDLRVWLSVNAFIQCG